MANIEYIRTIGNHQEVKKATVTVAELKKLMANNYNHSFIIEDEGLYYEFEILGNGIIIKNLF